MKKFPERKPYKKLFKSCKIIISSTLPLGSGWAKKNVSLASATPWTENWWQSLKRTAPQQPGYSNALTSGVRLFGYQNLECSSFLQIRILLNTVHLHDFHNWNSLGLNSFITNKWSCRLKFFSQQSKQISTCRAASPRLLSGGESGKIIRRLFKVPHKVSKFFLHQPRTPRMDVSRSPLQYIVSTERKK